jgi:hypothetical protein
MQTMSWTDSSFCCPSEGQAKLPSHWVSLRITSLALRIAKTTIVSGVTWIHASSKLVYTLAKNGFSGECTEHLSASQYSVTSALNRHRDSDVWFMCTERGTVLPFQAETERVICLHYWRKYKLVVVVVVVVIVIIIIIIAYECRHQEERRRWQWRRRQNWGVCPCSTVILRAIWQSAVTYCATLPSH